MFCAAQRCGGKLYEVAAFRRGVGSLRVSVHGADFVTDETFEEVVLKSPVPVVVDFWAPWCGPCRMIAPIIDELQQEYGDKLLCVSGELVDKRR